MMINIKKVFAIGTLRVGHEDCVSILSLLLIIFFKSGITPILSPDLPFADGVPYNSLLKMSCICPGDKRQLQWESTTLCTAIATPAIIAVALEVPQNSSV